MSRPSPGPSEVRGAVSFVRRAAALAGLLFCAFAYAKPLSVAIIPGNSSMQPTIAAVKQLKAQEKALEDVRFHVLPTGLEERHRQALADADVALVHNMGREIAAAVTAPVREMALRGAKAYAVGAPFEEGEKKAGLTRDEELRAYTQEGGVENIAAMIKRLLARDFGFDFEVGPPKVFPREGLWNPRTGKMYERFEEYAADYFKERPEGRGHVWVAIMFYRNMALSGDSPLLQSLTGALEARGFNVLPAFGYPPDALVRKILLSPEGKPRVVAAVSFVFKMGGSPKKTTAALQELGVPAINVISLQNQSQEEWEASPLGLTLSERTWQVAIPELVGAVAPTVVAAKEIRRDEESGFEYVLEVPIDERVERAADRVKKWVSLRYELNRNKRVALLYYNYPPGKENIGASYLNVLPKSLWQILLRLEREKYDTTGRPENEEALFELLHEHGSNMTSLTPGALEKMVRGGHVVLWSVSEYRKAFDKLPEKLRDAMIRGWGEPENFKFMLWRDKKSKPYFVFPAQRFGNVLFAPQPTRGWGEDVAKMYHDVTLPPHHQYLAFYLWLQKEYRTHAMVHVGTHATHEWLSGKEIGFTAADPGEVMVGDVPQVYPYIVDDVGEAIQAKRRGMATIVSHMTPPFTIASLNKELTMLRGLIDDYVVSAQKNEAAADVKRAEVSALAEKLGVLKDIGKKSLENGEDVEVLEHYLKEVGEEKSPYGLHTFGVAPPEELRRSTAEAILSVGGELTPEERERRILELSATIEASAKAELDALVAGLAGRYITPGPGGDPIRNPDSLPTGRNLYGFDPSRMPSPGVWAFGKELADKFIADYRKAHDGEFPDRVVFNLWMTEAMRHEGVTESEILALMGVKPVWNERGQLGGVEVIPRAELGRPRVDVTVVPSGLYRDALPTLMLLIDEAVSKVKDLNEDDNPIYANVLKTARALESRGVAPEDAKRMAAVRIFTEASGAYGTGINNVIQASNTWEDDGKVADVYFNRVGNLFGQGYWGESPGGKALAVDIFKMALKDAKAAIHARSSNLYGTLDNDDVFQYLGGTAMAIRQVNGGKSPETYILNLSGARGAEKHETLDKFIGREMRTRYTNPEWIKGMMKEGYSGARAVMEVTHNLWGWQVTTPEAIDGAKWQEMYETYVTDRNELGIKEMFRESKNMLAYQSMVDKMLVAVNKGYWQADADVKERLEKLNTELIAEAGVACDAASCSSAEVVALAVAADAQAMADAANMPAPNVAAMTGGVAPRAGLGARAVPARSAAAPVQGAAPERNAPPPQGADTPPTASANPAAPVPPPAPTQVEGFEVQEIPKPSVDMTPEEKGRALLGFVFLVCAGFFLRSRNERRLEMLDYELPY
ncbi:MAG: cobaltochelatase subunit CobN [Candidatus Accumulibacter sp.]|nr:cobaltochelatase subunit CobN [Accumulibacter sp.]